MAAVTLHDGALAAGASSAWVAVNPSLLYTIQVSGTGAGNGQIIPSLSNDGTNVAVLDNVYTVVTSGDANNRYFKISNLPTAFLRVTNVSASSITLKAYAVAS